MSLTIPQASQAGLFKPGYNSYDAEDGAVIRNVWAIPRSHLGRFLMSSRSMPAERLLRQSKRPWDLMAGTK